ncbi:Bug family tripartite tricarboxylate transporter substrate binding protein [Variovorax sp. HJSM1_2]|uniref:Bug family tripartite tricarboxylate transporter substrate binding protein n=1 Tax=Variovorax sp. HJSM1_2 TaxID=3366263 RepID=UPI003BD32EE4
MRRRSFMARCSAALALAGPLAQAGAQTYPVRPIQLFVALGPGGAGDLVARMLAKKMGESMGQPVVVENRPSPVVAVATVAKAKPDGYTMMMAGSGTALSSSLFKSLPYDLMADFIHVSTMASFDLALVTGSQSSFNSVADVLAYAKANPGKLNIGTIRIGSTQHLSAEMFKSMAGIDVVVVPYKTTPDVVTALRANDVQVAMEILSPVLGQIKGKNIKALAVTSTHRFPGLPDVPTVAESGVPGFEASSWNGISVPARTPAEIVARLGKEVQAAISSPEVLAELQAMGIVASPSTSEQMSLRMKRDMAKWQGVIHKAGIPRQ